MRTTTTVKAVLADVTVGDAVAVRIAPVATPAPSRGLTICSAITNAGIIYVGDSTVSATNKLAELEGGDVCELETACPADVYLIASIPGQVAYGGVL